MKRNPMILLLPFSKKKMHLIYFFIEIFEIPNKSIQHMLKKSVKEITESQRQAHIFILYIEYTALQQALQKRIFSLQ